MHLYPMLTKSLLRISTKFIKTSEELREDVALRFAITLEKIVHRLLRDTSTAATAATARARSTATD